MSSVALVDCSYIAQETGAWRWTLVTHPRNNAVDVADITPLLLRAVQLSVSEFQTIHTYTYIPNTALPLWIPFSLSLSLFGYIALLIGSLSATFTPYLSTFHLSGIRLPIEPFTLEND